MKQKKCPICKALLVEKANTKNGHIFRGCPNYPDCKYTENYKKDKVVITIKIEMPYKK